MNHLVIGLGGTGGKIIRNLRKLMHQEYRSGAGPDARIAYLYVDSSNEMMSADDPSWKVFGVSLQLPRSSQLLITDASLGERLENIDNYPGIKPWIGDRSDWQDILGSIVGVTLGGQKRRLGRFLFACKADKFKELVSTQVKELQSGDTAETTFHVLTGLAGGTGSGSVVDVVSTLRDMYPDSRRYRTLIYALLPDPYPPATWDTGNYHANGYAALLELNALSVGAYRPYDLLGVKGRLTLSDPFNGCYVYSNENEHGITADVDKQIPTIIADFLFHKLTGSSSVGWPSLARMENAENGDGSPETAANSRAGERSKRFLTLGIKRIAVPEEEIGEYLTFSYVEQAALQLRFNNWQDTFGFAREAKQQDFHELVRQKDTALRWLLSDEHLLLSFGILPEDAANKRWKTIPLEWETVIVSFKSLVRDRERRSWLDELTKLCQQRYADDYRGLGVQNFYRTKLKAKREMAREIRLRIEHELWNDWAVGARASADCAKLVTALVEQLEERLSGFDDSNQKSLAGEEEVTQRLAVNSEKWAEMGFVSKVLLGTPDSLFDAHALLLQQLYVLRTRQQGYMFAKSLLQELIAELTDLRGQIESASALLEDVLKAAAKSIAARCNDTGPDIQAQLVRFYDPALVRKIARSLTLDENEQKTQATRVRNALREKLGDTASFSLFNQRISREVLLDTLEAVCERSVQVAHANLVQQTKQAVLGTAIIGELRQRYASDPGALSTFVADLVSRAGTFLALDPLELHKVAPGIPAGVPTAISKFSVVVPKAPEHAEFVVSLKAAFRAARSGDVEILESDDRQREIVLLSLVNLFPLRYAKALGFLRQRYETRLAQGGARARLELHSEGDGNQFPRLFVASSAEVKTEGLPLVLLARAMGFVREGLNPATGLAEALIVTKDDNGFDNDPVILGKSFQDAAETLDMHALSELRKAVNAALAGPLYVHEDQRSELTRKVLASVEEVKASVGGNVLDSKYKRFLDAGKAAVKLMQRER